MNPQDTHREDLSALIDGALDADRTRFLLRRLQHDGELAGDLSRWQLAGDALRGQPEAPAPAGFAEAVAARIAGEPVPVMQAAFDSPSSTVAVSKHASAAVQPRSPAATRWRWFGGGAVAASLAFAMLLALRTGAPAGGEVEVASASRAAPPVATAPEASAPVIASTDAAPEAASPVEITPAPKPASPSPRVREDATPVRIARAGTPAPRSEPASVVARPTDETPHVALDDSAVARHVATPPATDPFQPPAARAWPKAAVPGAGAGTFNASLQADSPYYPFVPRTDAASAGE